MTIVATWSKRSVLPYPNSKRKLSSSHSHSARGNSGSEQLWKTFLLNFGITIMISSMRSQFQQHRFARICKQTFTFCSTLIHGLQLIRQAPCTSGISLRRGPRNKWNASTIQPSTISAKSPLSTSLLLSRNAKEQASYLLKLTRNAKA